MDSATTTTTHQHHPSNQCCDDDESRDDISIQERRKLKGSKRPSKRELTTSSQLIPLSPSLLNHFDDFVSNVMDIPHFLKEHNSNLRFPEKLLLMILQAEREALKHGLDPQGMACLAWTRNGQAFIVRNARGVQDALFPLSSSASYRAKFSSFTRKLYRWGFRQLKTDEKEKTSMEKIFYHPLFQRDNKPLVAAMKSVTAEGTRKFMSAQSCHSNQKFEAKQSQQFQALSPSEQRPSMQNLPHPQVTLPGRSITVPAGHRITMLPSSLEQLRTSQTSQDQVLLRASSLDWAGRNQDWLDLSGAPLSMPAPQWPMSSRQAMVSDLAVAQSLLHSHASSAGLSVPSIPTSSDDLLSIFRAELICRNHGCCEDAVEGSRDGLIPAVVLYAMLQQHTNNGTR